MPVSQINSKNIHLLFCGTHNFIASGCDGRFVDVLCEMPCSIQDNDETFNLYNAVGDNTK